MANFDSIKLGTGYDLNDLLGECGIYSGLDPTNGPKNGTESITGSYTLIADSNNRQIFVSYSEDKIYIRTYDKDYSQWNGWRNQIANAIEDNTVYTSCIRDNAVSTDKIKNSAVTSGKIASGSVTTTKLDAEAVTKTKLASDAVTTLKIADNAVTEEKLAETVQQKLNQAGIADGSITEAKLDSALQKKVNGVQPLDNSVNVDDILEGGIYSGKMGIDRPEEFQYGDAFILIVSTVEDQKPQQILIPADGSDIYFRRRILSKEDDWSWEKFKPNQENTIISNPDGLNGVHRAGVSPDGEYTYIAEYDPDYFDEEGRGYSSWQTRINNYTGEIATRTWIFNKPDQAYWSAWTVIVKPIRPALAEMKGPNTEWDETVAHNLPRRAYKSQNVDFENIAYHMNKTTVGNDENENAWAHGATPKAEAYKIAARNGYGDIEVKTPKNIENYVIDGVTGKVSETNTSDLGNPKGMTNKPSSYLPNATKSEGGVGPNAVNVATVLRHRHYATLDHPDGCVTTEKLANGAVTKEKLAENVMDGMVGQNDFSAMKFDVYGPKNEYVISMTEAPKITGLCKEMGGTIGYPATFHMDMKDLDKKITVSGIGEIHVPPQRQKYSLSDSYYEIDSYFLYANISIDTASVVSFEHAKPFEVSDTAKLSARFIPGNGVESDMIRVLFGILPYRGEEPSVGDICTADVYTGTASCTDRTPGDLSRLTTDNQLSVIDAVNELNAVVKPMRYKKKEQDTGETWFDGSKIYKQDFAAIIPENFDFNDYVTWTELLDGNMSESEFNVVEAHALGGDQAILDDNANYRIESAIDILNVECHGHGLTIQDPRSPVSPKAVWGTVKYVKTCKFPQDMFTAITTE